MKKKLVIASSTPPDDVETEKQFAKRIRVEALEKLQLNDSGFNTDALAAAMSLSEQTSFLGDLSKKSKKRRPGA